MAENGINILRIMLEYAHVNTRFFERPAGRFNPSMVRLWDDLFARCDRFGIRVLLAPWDNYWLALRWRHHPYNAANGGPAQTPQAFFTEEATIAATIRRLQFVVERWGGCAAFAAWDLFNEIHPHYGGTPAEQGAVITRISEAVREAELRMWGYSARRRFPFWPRT
jgi:mannan endo-1,4-beta-mannosidase